MYCRNASLARGELRRLGGKARGTAWNLTSGTTLGRTRGGAGRLELVEPPRTITIGDIVDSSDSEEEESIREPVVVLENNNENQENEAPEDEEGPTKKKRFVKPANHRVVLEVEQIEKVFGQLACRSCGEAVQVTVKNVCIATSIGIECLNEGCGFLYHPELAPPAATTIHLDRGDNFERNTDYAVNVLYVLGFMSMGDGCTEAARLLGLIGLPNDTTMKSRSFTIIENRIGPILRKLMDDMVLENLIEEARLSMIASATHDEHDFKVWRDSLTDKTIRLSLAKMPRLDGSYDMAWQQKGSGHQYNSLSGHGTIIGRYTRKVIALVIKCKVCNECSAWEKKNPDVENVHPHECWKNHNGSSGSMESAGIVQLVTACFDKYQAIVNLLCTDDDSSIRADCQWSNQDYLANNNTDVLPMVPKRVGKNKGELQPRPDKGKLPGHVPEPRFVADPNHRRKVLTGELIKLDTSKINEKHTMTRMDSTRLGKNFGYMARTLKTKSQAEFMEAANAVLEHHFDCHESCGPWCPRKVETPEQRSASKKYYRCKKRDAKLYATLVQVMSRFVTMDRLDEMAHDLDTNMNEAFNNICTWFAPKNKVFAGSGSLNNRIAFAVGINSLGVLPFYTKLFHRLGITMTENVEHYLKVKEALRMKQIESAKSNEAKKAKNKLKYLKLQEDTRVAKMEFHKRTGTYRKGMNVDDPYGELLNGQEVQADARKPAARRKRKKTDPGFCEWCGSSSHATKRNKKCTAALDAAKKYRKHDGSLLSDAPVAAVAVQPVGLLTDEAMDIDRFDSLPWDHQLDSDDDSFRSALEEAATGWDSDGDESVQAVLVQGSNGTGVL
jgi:hypothetical protein